MRALFAFAVVIIGAPQLLAEMASQPLEQVAWESELIVLATVTEVSPRSVDEKSYATAEVLETWKGAPSKAVEFLAEPSWSCDISEATAGETVVLFLIAGEPSRSCLLSASGGGRMPLRTVDGNRYVTVFPYVILPSSTPTIPGPFTESPDVRSVQLDTLRALVAAILRTPPKDPWSWPATGLSAHAR